jgi:signal transduction histidine kinase
MLKSGVHDAAFYNAVWETLREGETWSGQITNRRKDGTTYTVHASISPVRDGEGRTTAFVAVERDLTDWLAIQERLDEARAFEALGMLAGRVAHDVRNPLFAIGVNVAALEKALGGDAAAEAFLSNIRQQSTRLANLMNDLLVMGKPLKPETFRPVSLSVIAERALAAASSEPEGGPGRFRLEPEAPMATVSGAPDQLVQAVHNLLINARHFSPPELPVLVRVWGEGDHAILSVHDAGPGVPPDQMGRVFDAFFSTRTGGTGLGLAIVRKIVEAHGGSAEVANNTPEPGATFTIRLPLATG